MKKMYGHGKKSQKALVRLGYSDEEVSELWQLDWFVLSFFKRFGMCYLHIELWGELGEAFIISWCEVWRKNSINGRDLKELEEKILL